MDYIFYSREYILIYYKKFLLTTIVLYNPTPTLVLIVLLSTRVWIQAS